MSEKTQNNKAILLCKVLHYLSNCIGLLNANQKFLAFIIYLSDS